MRKITTFFLVILCMLSIMGCSKHVVETNSAGTVEETEPATLSKEEKYWDEMAVREYGYKTRMAEYPQYLIDDRELWRDEAGNTVLPAYEDNGEQPYSTRLVYNIPESIEDEFTAEELFELILQVPFTSHAHLGNTNRQSFAIMADCVNLFDLFLAKAGAANILYEYYMDEEKMNAKEAYFRSAVELMLAQDCIYDGVTEEQREQLVKAVKDTKYQLLFGFAGYVTEMHGTSKWSEYMEE